MDCIVSKIRNGELVDTLTFSQSGENLEERQGRGKDGKASVDFYLSNILVKYPLMARQKGGTVG